MKTEFRPQISKTSPSFGRIDISPRFTVMLEENYGLSNDEIDEFIKTVEQHEKHPVNILMDKSTYGPLKAYLSYHNNGKNARLDTVDQSTSDPNEPLFDVRRKKHYLEPFDEFMNRVLKKADDMLNSALKEEYNGMSEKEIVRNILIKRLKDTIRLQKQKVSDSL